MAYVETWSTVLEASPTAVCQWGSDHAFLAYGNGLMEVRSLATGEVVAQGFSPFDAYGGSGGGLVVAAGYCRDGLGVLATSIYGNPYLATLRVDINAKSMDVGQNFEYPLQGAHPNQARVVMTAIDDLLSDGFPVGYPSGDAVSLATSPTGGMLHIPLPFRGGDRTIPDPIRRAPLPRPDGAASNLTFFVGGEVRDGKTRTDLRIDRTFSARDTDTLVATYTLPGGGTVVERFSGARVDGGRSPFAVNGVLTAFLNATADDPPVHVKVELESSPATGSQVYDVLADTNQTGGIPYVPRSSSTQYELTGPAHMGGWFDVNGFDDIVMTHIRAETANAPRGTQLTVIRGSLRHLEGTKYRNAYQVFDREQPMPVPAPTFTGFNAFEYQPTTPAFVGSTGVVVNLAPRPQTYSGGGTEIT